MGELGGSNLYGFVENDPVNGWDYLGLVLEGPDYTTPRHSIGITIGGGSNYPRRIPYDWQICDEIGHDECTKPWTGYKKRKEIKEPMPVSDPPPSSGPTTDPVTGPVTDPPNDPVIDPTIGSDIDPTRSGREIDPAKGEPKVYDAPDLPEMIVLHIRETGQKLTIEDGVITYNSIYDFNDNGIYEPDELDHIRRLQRQEQHVRELEERIREIYRANPHQFGADVGEKRYKSDMIRIGVVAGGTAVPIVIGESVILISGGLSERTKVIIALVLQTIADLQDGGQEHPSTVEPYPPIVDPAKPAKPVPGERWPADD